jgi:hypothetical protein
MLMIVKGGRRLTQLSDGVSRHQGSHQYSQPPRQPPNPKLTLLILVFKEIN